MADFRNPLGFHCAPNATDPHYASEWNFERFVAFGLLMSWEYLLGDGTASIVAAEADVRQLRENFLGELQIALDVLPELLEEGRELNPPSPYIAYQGDHDQNGVEVSLRPDVDDGSIRMAWQFDRLDLPLSGSVDDEHGTLLLILDCGEDDFSVWLSLEALEDPEQVAKVMQRAKTVNSQSGP